MAFNHDSRRRNVLKASGAALLSSFAGIVIQLGYRAIFLHILSYEYLGLDRLFADILGLLGLADLGIADAIIVRLYKPISREETGRVGALMHYFRRTYHLIALVILALGALLTPFLRFFIRDAGEIPPDADLTLIFLLLLLQTAATYLFSYKFSLLNADQRQNRTSLFNTLNALVRYSVQLLLLVTTESYTLTLAAGIAVTLLCNWLEGRWVERQYPQVFSGAERLSAQERGEIRRDTAALLMHKLGGTVVASTDSILLSRFIGLAVTGIYANYQMVLAGLSGTLLSLLGALSPTFGNIHATMTEAERYAIFKKTLFLNFWVGGLTVCCLYNLLDDFILLWVKQELFLDPLTVKLLCALFYMQLVRKVSNLYSVSCGLMNRDRFRPVIESALNIAISILALKRIGTAGIFLGTILSNLLTVFWREPYLLYRYAFGQRLGAYWRLYGANLAVTVAAVWLSARLKALLFPGHLGLAAWLACGVLCALVFQSLHTLAFSRTEEFHEVIRLLRRKK